MLMIRMFILQRLQKNWVRKLGLNGIHLGCQECEPFVRYRLARDTIHRDGDGLFLLSFAQNHTKHPVVKLFISRGSIAFPRRLCFAYIGIQYNQGRFPSHTSSNVHTAG